MALSSLDHYAAKFVQYYEKFYANKPDTPAVNPLIIAEAKDGFSCMVSLSMADRDVVLQTCKLLMPGVSCEMLVVGMDTLMKTVKKDELNEGYRPGSFQEELAEQGEKSGIKNALMVARIVRGGFRQQYIRAYSIHRESGSIAWSEAETNPMSRGGIVSDGLISAMQAPCMDFDKSIRLMALGAVARNVPCRVAFSHKDPVEEATYRRLGRDFGLELGDYEDTSDDEF